MLTILSQLTVLILASQNPICMETTAIGLVNSISIYLKTRGGQVVMHRKLGSNKIDVSSTDPSISNGKYTAKASGKNYEKTINSVWLALIGITEQHSINKNERSQKQVLSWRTFCHIVRNLQFSTFPQGDANRIVAVVLTSQQYASYNARKFL